MANPIPAYAVFTGRTGYDLELQIICTTKGDAIRERDELKKDYGMEDARVKFFEDEELAYDWFEARR